MPRTTDEDRRKQILKATMECVAEEGFDGATMRLIAKRANITTGGLTYYYPSKLELIIAAIDSAMEYGQASRDQMVGAAPNPRRLEATFRSLLTERQPESGPWAFWMECWSEAVRREELGPHRFFARAYEVVEQSLQAGIEQGVFDPDIDPKTMALLLHSMMIGLGIETTMNKKSVSTERAMQVCKAALALISRREGSQAPD